MSQLKRERERGKESVWLTNEEEKRRKEKLSTNNM